MHYDFTAIPDADVPQAVDPAFQHVVQTYASEANKTVGVWRAVPDNILDFKPHEKTNPIRTILVYSINSVTRTTRPRSRGPSPSPSKPGTSTAPSTSTSGFLKSKSGP